LRISATLTTGSKSTPALATTKPALKHRFNFRR
jgi:hypothetical protein